MAPDVPPCPTLRCISIPFLNYLTLPTASPQPTQRGRAEAPIATAAAVGPQPDAKAPTAAARPSTGNRIPPVAPRPKPTPPTPGTLEHFLYGLRSVHYCGTGTILVANKHWTHLTVVPVRCRNWRCPTCAPALAAMWADKIARSRPQRFLTLTCDPSRFADPDAAYKQMKWALPRLAIQLRKMNFKFEYVATWELHKSGWPHLHLLIKGTYIPMHLISRLWDGLDVGTIIDIRSVYSARGAGHYIAKYITKTATATKLIPPGHRLVTASRGFFTVHALKQGHLDDPDRTAQFYLTSPREVLRILQTQFRYTLHPSSTANSYILQAPDEDAHLPHIDSIDYALATTRDA